MLSINTFCGQEMSTELYSCPTLNCCQIMFPQISEAIITFWRFSNLIKAKLTEPNDKTSNQQLVVIFAW